jgi:hypothetical protein
LGFPLFSLADHHVSQLLVIASLQDSDHHTVIRKLFVFSLGKT